jgi:hypothetical protein
VGGLDLLPFYAAARLVPHGMYDPVALYRAEEAAVGPTLVAYASLRAGVAMSFMRLPVFALLAWPLSLLSYGQADAVWFVLRAMAAAGFVVAWPHTPRRVLALATAWFLPLAAALAGGQDSPFLLLWIALAERLAPRRPFAAGLALAMCAAKPHLFILLPVFLFVHRRRVIPGFLAGGTALLALSFAADGWRWPLELMAVLRNPASYPKGVANIHGLGLSPTVEGILTAAVAIAALAAIFRFSDRLALAATLTAGLLISFHASIPDSTILLPAVLLFVAGRRRPAAQEVKADAACA